MCELSKCVLIDVVPACCDVYARSKEELLVAPLCVRAITGHQSREELHPLFERKHEGSRSQ